MGKRTLKEIALDLLEMYEDAQETVTYEYSGNIDADIKKLKSKVARIRQEIDVAAWMPFSEQYKETEE